MGKIIIIIQIMKMIGNNYYCAKYAWTKRQIIQENSVGIYVAVEIA